MQSLQQRGWVHLPLCYAPLLAGSQEGKGAAAAAGQRSNADDAVLVWAALLWAAAPAAAACVRTRVSCRPYPCCRGCSAASSRRCCRLLLKHFDASRQGGSLGSSPSTAAAAAGGRHTCKHRQGRIREFSSRLHCVRQIQIDCCCCCSHRPRSHLAGCAHTATARQFFSQTGGGGSQSRRQPARCPTER
jgi:hypothetical protein